MGLRSAPLARKSFSIKIQVVPHSLGSSLRCEGKIRQDGSLKVFGKPVLQDSIKIVSLIHVHVTRFKCDSFAYVFLTVSETCGGLGR